MNSSRGSRWVCCRGGEVGEWGRFGCEEGEAHSRGEGERPEEGSGPRGTGSSIGEAEEGEGRVWEAAKAALWGIVMILGACDGVGGGRRRESGAGFGVDRFSMRERRDFEPREGLRLAAGTGGWVVPGTEAVWERSRGSVD